MRRHPRTSPTLKLTLILACVCSALPLPLALFAPLPALAQNDDWNVSASIDQTTASPRDILKFTIDIVGSGNLNPSLATEPSFHGFTITGRQRFTSIDNQNGRVVRKHHHLFLISPTQTGPLTIGPATILIGSQTFTTDPVTVEVESRAGTSFATPPIALPPTSPGTPPSISPGTPPATPSGQSGPIPAPLPGGDFFVEARAVDNVKGKPLSEVFVGQPFFLRYDIFRRQSLLHSSYQAREPQFTQFWPYDATDPNIDNTFGAGSRNRNGITYESELLQAYVLVPLDTGDLPISPIETEVHYGAGRGRHWIASPDTSIKVIPLPPGAPPGFDPRNVGVAMSFYEDTDARIIDAPDASLDKFRKGDSLTLSFSILGLGAVSHMKLAPLAAPKLHISPPEVVNATDEIIIRQVRGAKTFKIKVVAMEEGDIEVPAVTFSYFDTEEKSYKTLTAGPWKLKVEGASPDFDAIKRIIDAQGAPKGIDLGPGRPGLRSIILRDSPNLEAVGAAAPYQQTWYWALLGIAPALYVGLWLADLWKTRAAKTAPTKNSRKAAADAIKTLKNLRDTANPQKTQEAYAQVDQCLQAFLAARTQLKTKGMTTAELQKALEGAPWKVSSALVGELVASLNEARSVRYARGEQRSVQQQQADLDTALSIVERLEKVLR